MGVELATYKGVWEGEDRKEENSPVLWIMSHPTDGGAVIRKKGERLVHKSLTKGCAIFLYSLTGIFIFFFFNNISSEDMNIR